MNDKLFSKLWKGALLQPDKSLYLSEYSYNEWFDEIGLKPDESINILSNIHDIAHMPIRDMVIKSGLSQAKFAEKFCIPKRTVENWCSNTNKCPVYIRLMIARILGYLGTLNE